MMPFACYVNDIRIPHIHNMIAIKKKKIKDILVKPIDRKTQNDFGKERVSSFITRIQKGSLTIEAAMALPIFLFASVLILMLSDALCLHTTIEAALHQNVKKAAQQAYVHAPDENQLYQNIMEDIGLEYLERAPIEGGSSGIFFENSSVGASDRIDLRVQYRLKFPYDIFGIGSITMSQRCLAHEWVGYGQEYAMKEGSKQEEYVYITPHGTVYHRSSECTHLRLSIREVTASQLKSLRNIDGGRYKRCEHCRCSLSSEHIYITDSGDRYHDSLTCSGLKRDIIAIPISEVEGRRPCSRCGGQH